LQPGVHTYGCSLGCTRTVAGSPASPCLHAHMDMDMDMDMDVDVDMDMDMDVDMDMDMGTDVEGPTPPPPPPPNQHVPAEKQRFHAPPTRAMPPTKCARPSPEARVVAAPG
jgi:hypothetical protein